MPFVRFFKKLGAFIQTGLYKLIDQDWPSSLISCNILSRSSLPLKGITSYTSVFVSQFPCISSRLRIIYSHRL